MTPIIHGQNGRIPMETKAAFNMASTDMDSQDEESENRISDRISIIGKSRSTKFILEHRNNHIVKLLIIFHRTTSYKLQQERTIAVIIQPIAKVDGIQSLYCDSGFVVVEEILELLYQSNPTLIPMKGFDFEMYINQHYKHDDDDKESDADETDRIGGSQVKMKDNDSANTVFNMKKVVKIECANEHVIIDDAVITPFYDKVGQELDIDSAIYCQNSDSKSKYISEEDDRNIQMSMQMVHANST
eukprot:46344_1